MRDMPGPRSRQRRLDGAEMTLDWTTLAGFSLTSLIVELTPGPNMAYLTLIAATQGRRSGYAAVAGVALGLGVMGVAAALGMAALVLGWQLAYQALRWAGIAFLIWLAWDAWRGPSGEALDESARPGSALGLHFRRGFITNLLNPKAALFFIAVLPGFLSPAAGLPEVALLSLVYVAVATAVHLALVTAAGAAQGWLADGARAERVRRIMALGLLGVAFWVALRT